MPENNYGFTPTQIDIILREAANKEIDNPRFFLPSEDYKTSYGIWSVSTEGDCEGISTIQLGVFQGHVDDIACYLASKAYYCLSFTRILVKEIGAQDKSAIDVHVQFDIKSDTWNMDPKIRASALNETIFCDRPVLAIAAQQFGCVKLIPSVSKRNG